MTPEPNKSKASRAQASRWMLAAAIIAFGISALVAAADTEPVRPLGDQVLMPGTPDGVSQIGGAVAGSGEGFLAVWMEVQADGNADVVGARIDPDGDLLDATPLAISNGTGDQILPQVAAYPGGFLVVWADTRNESSSSVDIYAARVTSEGEVLDPDGIPICTAPGPQFLPGVAHEIRTGIDPNGTEPDATITLNGGFVDDAYWY